MMSAKAQESLQLNFLSLFEKKLLTDCTIVVEGKEIVAHRVILAAQSEWLAERFLQGQDKIMLDRKFKVIYACVRFMYFGGVEGSLAPDEALDMLLCAEELGIRALDVEDVVHHLREPRLTFQNSVLALQHEVLPRYPAVQEELCEYVGANFLEMLKTMEEQLLAIPRHLLANVLRGCCHYVGTDADTERVVRFCLQHSQLESACDLLRETKQWNWGGEEVSLLRSAPGQEIVEGAEWRVENVRTAMESTPARIVVGKFFDWCIRLDYGAEGRLRIVYESATPRENTPRCINRFPAAMFAWNVLYRGQDVFNEKPVFICFPENVSLHWSTTLPVSAAELTDNDDLRIMVNMAENPMLSLVLYYFSADLKTTVFSEDILNRLPHIEYRCLSSYSLVKTHVPS